MKTSGWKEIAELVGIAAIVASLIFVGLQLKQSQEIAVANQYQDRADAALEWYLAQIQSNQALSARATVYIDEFFSGNLPQPLNNVLESDGREMVAMRYLFFRSNMTMFDNYHFQYEQGFLTDDAWQAFRVRLKGVLSRDISAAMYRQEAAHYRKSFQDVCSQIIEELEADPKS